MLALSLVVGVIAGLLGYLASGDPTAVQTGRAACGGALALLLRSSGPMNGASDMAQHTQVLYIDDIDGGEADGTVKFGYSGTEYEIDLSKKNADKLAKVLQPYIGAARRVGASSRRGGRGTAARASRHDQSAVREWARSQGLKVSDRGRIPADILSSYEAAH
jgi:hypothetical protein